MQMIKGTTNEIKAFFLTIRFTDKNKFICFFVFYLFRLTQKSNWRRFFFPQSMRGNNNAQ